MFLSRRSGLCQSSLCPLSRRLAFAQPIAVHAAPSSNDDAEGIADVSPAYPLMGPTPISLMSPAERVAHVVATTTSNLINGCVIGAIFGFVSGVWSTRSFSGAFREAGTMAKSWASISAIYAGIQTTAKVLRGKDDRYNAIVGACGSGAFFQARAGPTSAAQGCVSFAALSYLIDSLTASKKTDQSDDLSKPR